MTTFDDREKAFESKYVHDEELKFKIVVRRNKLLGLWAAEKMGITGEAAEAHAKEVVKSDFEEAGHEDVFRKVKGDFDATHVEISEAEIRAKMNELLAVAEEQVRTE